MKTINISDIKAEFGGDKAPKDEKAIELFKKAYSGELMCHVALIKAQGIKPFSDFKPKTPEDFTKLLEKGLQDKKPIPIYVYQEDYMFVMSDDYNAYYYYLEKGLDKILCITLGEPTGPYVVEKSEPFKLPPLTAEPL